MARINPSLLERIQQKLGIGQRQAYERIAAKANKLMVGRDLAAIAVAAEAGINVSKGTLATEDQRGALRAATTGRSPREPAPAPPRPSNARPAPGTRRRSQHLKARKSNSVMVVHRRNIEARDALFAFLRTIGLQPIEFTQAVKKTKRGAPYVGQVLDTMFAQAAAVVVLLTADDEAQLKTEFRKPTDPAYERRLTGQARPNVLFEAGRAFGTHPDETILVQVGPHRPFTDISGVHIVHLGNDPSSRQDLANRLEQAGCATNTDGTDWFTAGDFGSKRRRRLTRK